MKTKDITPGRYLCKIDGERTIVKAFKTRGGIRYRCEKNNRFVSLTARRLWRPVKDTENISSSTITNFNYSEQVSFWDGHEIAFPVIGFEEEPLTLDHVDEVRKDMFQFALADRKGEEKIGLKEWFFASQR